MQSSATAQAPGAITFVRRSRAESGASGGHGNGEVALQIVGGGPSETAANSKLELEQTTETDVIGERFVSTELAEPSQKVHQFSDARRFMLDDSDSEQWGRMMRLNADEDAIDEQIDVDMLDREVRMDVDDPDIDDDLRGPLADVVPLMRIGAHPSGAEFLISADECLGPCLTEAEDFPLSGQLQFPRVDSDQILYQIKQKQPKIIDQRYLIGELLGEGSYGKVKEALDCDTLCRRVVKILKQRRLRKIPNGEQDVQREIRMLRRLRHKNVIQLFDVVHNSEKQKMYLVMEYCVGSLQEMLDTAPGKRFSVWQAHRYFVQLLDGLQYLHGAGIVHKDIKPGNLLLSLDETLKIIDLGVAEELDRYQPDDSSFVGRGTPKFQPPEIAAGQTQFSGFAVDIWSSGVTLYNFVSGQYPFEGENVYKLYDNISKRDVQMPPDIDSSLQDLLFGMLRKSANERFKMTDIRAHAWTVRKHPLTLDRVPLPAYRGDPLRRMTVYSYLEMFYGGTQAGGSSLNVDQSPDTFVTERQLRQQQHDQGTYGSDPGCSAAAHQTGNEPASRDRSFFSSMRRLQHLSQQRMVRKSSSEPHTNNLNSKPKPRIGFCKVQ